MRVGRFLIATIFCLSSVTIASAEVVPLRVGTFSVDASPPVGSPLAYDPCESVQLPLACRGIVLLGNDKPIVLCAVDWIGIGNGGNDEWRAELAKAAGTTPSRVSVHTLHQHDAPLCDFETADLLAKHGLDGYRFDNEFAREVISQAADTVRFAIEKAVPVTHIGVGTGEVKKVASNRRILDENGKVRAVRYTATRNPKLQAEPEGIIDPLCRAISFFHSDQPVAVVTYYATHPQSYYRTGKANPDFPGMARMMRDEALQSDDNTGPIHIHFNGAGGNIGAGKYNDGSPENRPVLAKRLAEGMRLAWEDSLENRSPITAKDLDWNTTSVQLPVGKHLNEPALLAILEDDEQNPDQRVRAARNLVWLRRCQKRVGIEIGCLALGDARVLHMPGELVVEYQLEAQKMRPDLFVAMAAYGDYAPGYICRAIHYEQGGYESSQRASRVAPEVEGVLRTAMRELLDVSAK
ncbi:hypothetical protein [Thalassoroseus pseudoceratinae]|uniref:hypothetical protein n=1 Tax=Thalassoroseus pseudoceratinae TaxID=2713176 RepID=UPI00197FE052|nr:hypothetical protein [Thalassoroseus pseudoceratinae]